MAERRAKGRGKGEGRRRCAGRGGMWGERMRRLYVGVPTWLVYRRRHVKRRRRGEKGDGLTSSAPNKDTAPSTPEHSPAQSATCGSLGATNRVILYPLDVDGRNSAMSDHTSPYCYDLGEKA